MNKSAVIGLLIALASVVALAALKPLIGVKEWAQTIQPALIDANFVGQAEDCQALYACWTQDAGCGEDGGCTDAYALCEDAGGCSEDASTGYDANVLGVGSANQIANTDGFNSVVCFNPSTSVLYFGSSTVTTSTGFPVCNAATTCAGSSVAIDTNQGQVYATAAARVDGGYPIRCLAGH